MTELRAAQARVRQAPRGVVQDIKRLPTELEQVLLIRQTKIFVRGEVPVKTGGPDHCVAADIAEGVERLQRKCACVEPFRRTPAGHRLADPGRIRAVHPDIGVGPVNAIRRVHRKTGSPGDDGAELPITQHSVHKSVPCS